MTFQQVEDFAKCVLGGAFFSVYPFTIEANMLGMTWWYNSVYQAVFGLMIGVALAWVIHCHEAELARAKING